jgi:phage-related minor tail protein
MNSDTMESSSSSMTSGGLNGTGSSQNANMVKRVAQKAHEAVDKLEQSLNTGGEKVTGWQEEYGGQAREQIKANPLTAVAIAFFAGVIFSRVL